MRRRVLTALLGVGLLVGINAPPALGVDPVPGRPLPDEPPVVNLGSAGTAITLDLDADGVRELLAIGAAPGDPSQAVVTAWWVAADGSVAHADSVELRGADGTVMAPVDGLAVVVMAARRGGSEGALVATSSPADLGGPCCVLWSVAVRDGELDLQPVGVLARDPQQIVAVDMDADGTDEILVTSRVSAATVGLSVLRWTGRDFIGTEMTIRNTSSTPFTILDAGDTDGLPGEEVLLTGPATLGSDLLFRISLRSGAAVLEGVETAALPPGDSGFASVRALDTESGPAIVSSDGYWSLGVWTWPRDGQPTLLATRDDAEGALSVLGTDATARLMLATTPYLGVPGGPGYRMRAWPGQLLEQGGEPVNFEMDERAASFVRTVALHRESHPFVGTIPGGLPGVEDVLVWAGLQVNPRIPSGEPMALLAGVEPIGTVGPGGAWIALGPAVYRRPCCFYGWQPGPDVAGPAWWDLVDPSASLRLAATASVLEPEPDGGRLRPTYHGVAVDPSRPLELRVGSDTVEAEISGPEGTTVWWSADAAPGAGLVDPAEPRRALIGPSGSVRISVLDPAGIDSERASEVTIRMWAVTPAGHGYAGSWPITFDREPPQLTLTEPPLLDFDPTIAGIADGAVSLTADAVPVPVAADGSFTVAVSAGLLPTAVRVVAVDDFGNRAEHVVERVWGVDYRRIPLVPLAVAATIGVGILLYLRRPRGGARHPPAGVGTFEEFGG